MFIEVKTTGPRANVDPEEIQDYEILVLTSAKQNERKLELSVARLLRGEADAPKSYKPQLELF